MLKPQELCDKLCGSVVAMTTHFKDDYTLDLDAMKRLTEFYIEQKVPAVIVTGSTGEFFAMTDEERKAAQKVVVDTARDTDMIVIAGTAHSGTQACIELTKYAQDIGADGVMITPPYYGTNGGGFPIIQNHYDTITRQTEIGVVIYFSGAVMWQVQDVLAKPTMLGQLIDSCNGNAAAFKDASWNFTFNREVSRMWGKRISIMCSGGMSYYYYGHQFGAKCCLTGLGNIWPKVEIEFCDLMEQGRYDEARKIVEQKDLPYLKVTMGTRRYWACLKVLQEMVGLPGGKMRPPLVGCTPQQREELQRMASELGLLQDKPVESGVFQGA